MTHPSDSFRAASERERAAVPGAAGCAALERALAELEGLELEVGGNVLPPADALDGRGLFAGLPTILPSRGELDAEDYLGAIPPSRPPSRTTLTTLTTVQFEDVTPPRAATRGVRVTPRVARAAALLFGVLALVVAAWACLRAPVGPEARRSTSQGGSSL